MTKAVLSLPLSDISREKLPSHAKRSKHYPQHSKQSLYSSSNKQFAYLEVGESSLVERNTAKTYAYTAGQTHCSC